MGFTEHAGGQAVSHADDFDVVIVGDQSGFPFLETVDAVMTALFRKFDAGQKVHLVLPNPDLIFPDADGFAMASGSVSMLLEAALELRYPNRRFQKHSGRFTEHVGGQVVSHADDFDVVIVGDQSGFPFLETVDAVMTALFRKFDAGQKVHLVLPNPDLIFPDADGFAMASGSVSMLLEAALELRYPNRPDLRFVPLGKPHAAIFEEALRLTGTRDMVMIGDTPETDILGANDFGLDSVLVTTGVASSDMSAIPQNMRPTYSLASLFT